MKLVKTYLIITVLLSIIFLKVFCKRRPKARIIGGRKANVQDFPSMACIILKAIEGVDFRGGTVIVSDHWSVTAAHCMAYVTLLDVRKRIAFVRSNSTVWTEHYVDHQIIDIFVYERYDSKLTDYDIALLKVRQPFKGIFEKPAKLPKSNYKYADHSTATVVGWGTTDPKAATPFVVTFLRSVSLHLVNHNSCKHSFKEVNEVVTDRMICAAAPGKDACVYDSGGPLYQNGYLIGLVSWGGSQCADKTLPGVYTKVALFSHWIQKKISRVKRKQNR